MIVVQCHAERKLFPPAKEDELTFMVCAYRAVSRDSLPDDAKSMDFTATGVMLPYTKGTNITLYGDKWEKKDNGYTLSVVSYEEEIPNSIKVISDYLCNLDGCQKSDANSLINSANGDDIMASLDGKETFEKEVITSMRSKNYSVPIPYAARRKNASSTYSGSSRRIQQKPLQKRLLRQRISTKSELTPSALQSRATFHITRREKLPRELESATSVKEVSRQPS